ncbi:MAG: VWA domain-containing protein, partial [Planctomycetia bacterium]
ELRARVTDLRIAWSIDSSQEHAIACCLLDLLAVTLDASGSVENSSPRAQLQQLVVEAMAQHMDADFERFLARDVLSLAQSQPLARRQAAIALLVRKPNPGVMLALLQATRDKDERIRSLALEGLSGWPDTGVHGLFLGLLENSRENGPLRAAEAHFSRVKLGAGTPEERRLAPLVRADIARGDWRAATRAIRLSQAIDDETAMPMLVSALEHWQRRSEAGLQSLRILRELEQALDDRTGFGLAFDANAWRAAWDAAVAGRRPVRAEPVQARTQAGFFALEIWSDRVTFVIDRSGSMSDVMKGKEARTRWREAVAQLLQCVRGLERGSRFNVVLFHDIAQPWKEELVPVTQENLSDLARWLDVTPGGSTALKAGVERGLLAFGEKSDRSSDRRMSESDTFVLLCDGATNEGVGWVGPFLERVQTVSRTRFHGVQIGTSGDGALEALARGSTGQFLRIEG